MLHKAYDKHKAYETEKIVKGVGQLSPSDGLRKKKKTQWGASSKTQAQETKHYNKL